MADFIIDANVPYYFNLWNNERFIHVFDLNDEMSDEEIWRYALKNQLTIITKDADFSTKIILHQPPPRVIHLKIGNMKMKAFYKFITDNWSEIESLIKKYKLLNVFPDRIEGIE